ncbi:hypothetical protein BH23PLA1_BH23PLA1_03740 [soil metagenome]
MRRVTELDSLRGLTALAIVFYHMHPEFAFGWTRVDLFLVLSGYLVTSIVLKYHRAEGFLLTLFARRALRIWPCYLLALVLTVVLNPYLNEPFQLDGWPYFLTFSQNIPHYWGAEPPPFSEYFHHTWTLAIIEQFYLLWPVLIVLLSPRRIVPMALALILLSLGTRFWGLIPWVLLARCDGLALGGMLAALTADPDRVARHIGRYRLGFSAAIVASAGLLALSLSHPTGTSYHSTAESIWPSITIFGSSLLYFGLLGLVVCASGHPALAVLRHPRLVALGMISYGLYLYHPLTLVAVNRLADEFGIGPRWFVDGLELAACMTIAWLSWILLERPINRLRGRFPFRIARETPAPHVRPRESRTGVSMVPHH